MPRKKTERKFRKGAGFTHKYQSGDVIKDLDCTYAQACNMLRKSWTKFKIAKSNSDEISKSEAQDKINEVQRALGLRVTDFEGYEQGVTDSWNEQE